MICKPFKRATINIITQLYGVNPQSYQPYGHTGIDFIGEYGTFLVAPKRCVITKLVNATTWDLSLSPLTRGYGIVMTDFNSPEYEYLYWHCLPVFPVNIGDIIEQGEVVAQMGNSGFCTSQGQVVPVEIKTDKPFRGTHLHFEVRNNGTLIDPLPLIDWSIPIQDVGLSILQKIVNNLSKLFK